MSAEAQRPMSFADARRLILHAVADIVDTRLQLSEAIAASMASLREEPTISTRNPDDTI